MAAYASVDDLFRHVRNEKKNAIGEYHAAQQEHLRRTGSESDLLKKCEREVTTRYDAKLDRLDRQYQQFRDLVGLTDAELAVRSANERLGLLNEDGAVQRRAVSESDYWSAIFNGNGIEKEWDGIQALAEEYVAIKNQTGKGTIAYNRTPRQREIVNAVVTNVMPYIKRLAEEMRRGRWDKVSKTYGHGPVKLAENLILLGKKASVEDLVQDGIANVIEKFGMYDPGRARFSTWLVLYTRAGMTQGFLKENNHVEMNADLFWYARKVIRKHPGREEFIRAITDKSTDELWRRHHRIGPQRAVLIYWALTGNYKNLWDSRRRDKDNASIGPLETILPDLNMRTPEEEAISYEQGDAMRAVLASLTSHEEKVMKMRFGVGEKSDRTVEKVAVDFETTRKRIRQIEAKALRRLRHPSRIG